MDAIRIELLAQEIEERRAGMGIREAAKRPVSAVADQREVRDVEVVRIVSDKSIRLQLLFDPGYARDDRIVAEQFAV